MSTKSKRRVTQLHRQWLRIVSYLLIVAVTLGAAGALLIVALTPPKLEPLAGKVLEIAANMGGFDKTEIRLKVGEPITVRLTSLDNQHHTDGGGQHQWAVDELGVNVIAPPLGSNTVTFTPEKPGEYTFYCDICCGGRANPTMNGKLIVEA